MVSGAAGGVTGVARTVGEFIKAAAGEVRVVVTVVITVVIAVVAIVAIIVIVIIVIVIVVVIGVGVIAATALAAVAGPGEVVVLGFDRRLEEGRR